jgi:Zn-finger nucleic acid-binding protein
MAEVIFGKSERKKDLQCPRDKALLKIETAAEAELDTCGKCGGSFFDSGELFKAFGIKADPSYWDRAETGGTVKNADIHCPNCETVMLLQDVKYEGEQVQIDRCGKCGGIWLDKGESQTLLKIGEKLHPMLEAEKQKAQEELAKMGDVDFSPPGLIARFLALFKSKKKAEAKVEEKTE